MHVETYAVIRKHAHGEELWRGPMTQASAEAWVQEWIDTGGRAGTFYAARLGWEAL